MWVNDKRHGEGSFYCAVDGTSYEGQWRDGRKEGLGVLRLAQGDSLEGIWKDGQLQQVTVRKQNNSYSAETKTHNHKKTGCIQ